MIHQLPSSKTVARRRKPRVLEESTVKYKTRKRTSQRPIRYKPIPIKPDEWDKYRGETIAFVDNQILAHGEDFDKVLQEVLERYGKKPPQSGIVPIRVGWAESNDMSILLGRLDVFQSFHF